MPRDLAIRLLLDDCDRMVDAIEYKNTMRVADMLEWLREVYCKGMPELRRTEIYGWALECSEIGGVDLVWLALKNKNAGVVAQK